MPRLLYCYDFKAFLSQQVCQCKACISGIVDRHFMFFPSEWYCQQKFTAGLEYTVNFIQILGKQE